MKQVPCIKNKVTNYQFLVNNFPRVFHFPSICFRKKLSSVFYLFSRIFCFPSFEMGREQIKAVSTFHYWFHIFWGMKRLQLESEWHEKLSIDSEGQKNFFKGTGAVTSSGWCTREIFFSIYFSLTSDITKTYFDRESFIELSIKLLQFRTALKLLWNKLWKSISDCKYKSLL